MTLEDNRTEEQKKTHTWLVVGTDKFLSGWGGAEGGLSYAAWACKPEDRRSVLDWVERRSDMLRVREVAESEYAGKYRPNSTYCVHCHIYVVEDGHPSLGNGR